MRGNTTAEKTRAASAVVRRLRELPRGRPLWHYLALGLTAGILPVALAATGLLLAQAGEEKARLELALANTAQTLSLAVDREVRGYEVLLRTLAESQALREADLARFYEVAARVARENEAVFISLFAADGRQLLNTALPYGAPLPQPFRYVPDPSQSPDEPAVGDVSALRRVISGARASNSNLFRSLTTGKLLININVPVMRDGALRYVMNIGLEPSVLRELLLAPTSSRDALGVIIDANDFILARWDGKPENVGTRAGVDYRRARAESNAFVTSGTSREGTQTMFAAHTSAVTGWTAVASVQGARLYAETNRIWLVGTLATLAGLIVGTALAYYLGRRINASMQALVDVASGGEPRTDDAIPAQEIVALRNALLRARSTEQEAAAERERSAATHARQIELEQAAKQKDRFIATLSHELRNPLGVIRNSVSLLRHGGKREAVLPVLERQTTHLARLIDDLLDLSRLAQGKVRLNLEPLDLKAVLNEAVELVQPQMNRRQQRIEIEQPAEPVRVHADAMRMRQVFANLLDNAAKYSPPGSRIAVALVVAGGSARVTIRDQGPGIDPALIESVFEPFVQLAEPGSKPTEGLGLGLPLSRELLQMQGGRIAVRNAEGGLEVEIELPLAGASSRA